MAQQPNIGANGLRIVSLVSENVKKLTAVEIKPNGDVVTISGANGAGKSSIIDSIAWALGGSAGIQKQPIRKGAQRAVIKLNLGEIIVERRFNENGGSTLSVESADGARYKSPQALLDAIRGELAFDPLAFTRMDPKDQVNELKRVAQIDVDLDKLDALNAGDYAKRTDVNRQVKSLRAQAEAIEVPADLPAERINEDAIVDEITQAADANARLEQRKAGRERAARDAKDHRETAQRLRTRAAELRAEAEQLEKNSEDAERTAGEIEEKLRTAEALPEPVNVEDLRKSLTAAKQTNAEIAARQRRRDLESEAAELEQQSATLTAQMDERTKQKADALANAKMPVPGLGLDNGVVTFNGIPFEQASAAEQLKVSFAIAKAANPKLRVITIKDASLLDDSSLRQIAEMAADGGYQVWLEKVDTSGKIGVYIEDGAVRAIDGEPVKAPAQAA
jgi:hypothetical protein